jgi:predicted SnoaL-like aldol condensation-catalyzing enzyme
MQHYPAGEAKIGVAAEVFPLYYCKQNGVENSVLAEHWDVIQDEASKTESKSGLPMFGGDFTN